MQGVFRGLGDTRSPLWATIICNGVNVVLDAVFIMYFGWGVTGAAWATIIGQVGIALNVLDFCCNHNLKSLVFCHSWYWFSNNVNAWSGYQPIQGYFVNHIQTPGY